MNEIKTVKEALIASSALDMNEWLEAIDFKAVKVVNNYSYGLGGREEFRVGQRGTVVAFVNGKPE